MGQMIPFQIQTLIPITAICMGITIMVLRIRATQKPTSAKKIILPPFAMSTGFLMFILLPTTRIPWSWAFFSFAIGAIFLATPLIRTSQFHIVEDQIYLKRSRAFIFILLLLGIVRFSLHSYIEQYLSIFQTAGLFFILAFGMLLPWRISMYIQYKQLQTKLHMKQTLALR
ncbi:cytochrome c biogenesis protein CcdC [Hazenella sp. IB182357]|uniref:Cytochrome c biogenesis protein CcdC n=1 Tax=Polycladospora coralii TaxID=2771432 RepID=A0A926RSF8_9BACL|nr:cytochrome c biogenesis protein CcdC [Polycladospora coralii]MBD1371130.1 cytochrome c biogenesis protein CcdC [Polycladospora coralii]MBS7530072.1 cytochrome c biogenesis protein CcdC [Polycladospora coralii]